MTGKQLEHIRTRRGLTLREFADQIGDISHTTLSRWEREPDSDIPSWVIERIMGKTVIPLPMEDLHALLEHARNTGQPFEAILAESIREYLAARCAPKNITAMPAAVYTDPEEPVSRLAEDPPAI